MEPLRVLGVVLTSGCNLRCGYCYQNARKTRTIDREVLRTSLDLLLGSRRREVDLVFLGGEPLLEFPLIREAVGYVEMRRRSRLRVRYTLATNGTLLHDEAAAFLAAHRISTQLSFDGVRPAQDFRGQGTFTALDRLLGRLRRCHPRFFAEDFGVSLTVHPAAIPYLADSIAYLMRKGVKEIQTAPIVTHDPGWKIESISGLDRQFARISRLCRRYYQRTGEVPLSLFNKTHPDDEHRPRGRAMCGAPDPESLTVDVDGQVYGCPAFAESYQSFRSRFLRSCLEPLRMGDLRDARFSQRLGLYPRAARGVRIFHDKQAKHSSYGRCRDCGYLSTCGVCPVSIGHIPGNADPDRIPDFACAWNRISLKYREGFPDQPDAVRLIRELSSAYQRRALTSRTLP